MFEFEPQDILSANITWVFPVIWPKSLSRDVLPVNITIILENGTHKPLKKQLIFSNQKIWLFSWVGFQHSTPLQAAACFLLKTEKNLNTFKRPRLKSGMGNGFYRLKISLWDTFIKGLSFVQ